RSGADTGIWSTGFLSGFPTYGLVDRHSNKCDGPKSSLSFRDDHICDGQNLCYEDSESLKRERDDSMPAMTTMHGESRPGGRVPNVQCGAQSWECPLRASQGGSRTVIGRSPMRQHLGRRHTNAL